MPEIKLQGGNLQLDDEGSGPPLLLVHGFPLDRSMWAGQVAGLSRRARVLAPDLPGFGASGGWTFDGFAAHGHDLGQSRLHATGLVVLGVDAERLRCERVSLGIVAIGEGTFGQADGRDGVGGIQLDDALVHLPRPLDLVDLEQPVCLEDLLDHTAEPT